ncbi:hypothetical protein M0805_004004 [Coniferiporia weirii]|nr:hypothetical protein M0805_004004 [Coniferiporia weirii]
MDEIIPNLWIGNIYAAADHESLRAHNIYSVLSAMRGSVSVHETFTHFQIQLDDMEGADALAFFPQCISFIENELDQGRGVLVHCMAGMSRSATIVAAYLMYAQQLDAQAALEMVVKARPCTDPNAGFLAQLEVFYQAAYKVSRKNKVMRMYYLERALDEIMNGDGTLTATSTSMFANFPRSPTDSQPATPDGSAWLSAPLPPRGPRRRIRCKMCRIELAAREHMLDHGEVGPATPASALTRTPAFSPVVSRRPSSNAHDVVRPGPGLNLSGSLAMTTLTPRQAVSRRGSLGAGAAEKPLATLNGEPVGVPLQMQMQLRRLSGNALTSGRPAELLGLTPLTSVSGLGSGPGSRKSSFGNANNRPRRPSGLTRELMLTPSTILEGVLFDDSSALDDEEDDDEDPDPGTEVNARDKEISVGVNVRSDGDASSRTRTTSAPPSYMTPMDLAAQLNAHPKLAALRSPGIGGVGGLQPMTPIASVEAGGAEKEKEKEKEKGKGGTMSDLLSAAARSPPLIANSACSGYFVEPMKWMEPFLEAGELAGKIICPNKKCNAKLGNYDWAGVCCSCKEWVTPGFCIHRSKVDEVVV